MVKFLDGVEKAVRQIPFARLEFTCTSAERLQPDEEVHDERRIGVVAAVVERRRIVVMEVLV
jgi:hypothetical protein